MAGAVEGDEGGVGELTTDDAETIAGLTETLIVDALSWSVGTGGADAVVTSLDGIEEEGVFVPAVGDKLGAEGAIFVEIEFSADAGDDAGHICEGGGFEGLGSEGDGQGGEEFGACPLVELGTNPIEFLFGIGEAGEEDEEVTTGGGEEVCKREIE